MTDLGYKQDAFSVTFYPVSVAGEEAWEELAKVGGGSAMFSVQHLPSIKLQLKQAGYTVRKNATDKRQPVTDDDLLAVLGF